MKTVIESSPYHLFSQTHRRIVSVLTPYAYGLSVSLADIQSNYYMVKNSAYFVLLLTRERVAGNKSTVVLLDAESLSRNVPTKDAVQMG